MADRGIYTDDLANVLAKRSGEKYRPSNGSEGRMFMARHCDVCKRDAEFRAEEGDSCPIVAMALFCDIDEAGYPSEWQYGPDGQPTCTAFESEGA